MTTLKQLIDQHCPGGVDYVRLGDVVTIKNGSDWKTQEPGSVAVYGSGGKMGAKVRIPASTEPSVLLPRKGSLEVQFVDTPFWNIDTAFRTETDPTRLCMKYFYYSMKGFNLSEISTSATRPSLTQTALKELSFPLPPREVQDKIVDYLDTFAALCENLDTDIAQREQQFSEYSEKLLASLPTDSQLGEHGEFLRGKGIQKKDFTKGGRPAFHYGQIHTKYGLQTTETAAFISEELFQHSALAQPGDLIIASTSEDDEAVAKSVVWLGKEPAAVGSDAHFYRHEYEPRFISYFFATEGFHRQKAMLLTGAKVRRINAVALASIKAPFPPLETQQEIADKLDAMQELIDNLRLERQQRQQQFDHYRERLLSFPKKNTAEV